MRRLGVLVFLLFGCLSAPALAEPSLAGSNTFSATGPRWTRVVLPQDVVVEGGRPAFDIRTDARWAIFALRPVNTDANGSHDMLYVATNSGFVFGGSPEKLNAGMYEVAMLAAEDAPLSVSFTLPGLDGELDLSPDLVAPVRDRMREPVASKVFDNTMVVGGALAGPGHGEGGVIGAVRMGFLSNPLTVYREQWCSPYGGDTEDYAQYDVGCPDGFDPHSVVVTPYGQAFLTIPGSEDLTMETTFVGGDSFAMGDGVNVTPLHREMPTLIFRTRSIYFADLDGNEPTAN